MFTYKTYTLFAIVFVFTVLASAPLTLDTDNRFVDSVVSAFGGGSSNGCGGCGGGGNTGGPGGPEGGDGPGNNNEDGPNPGGGGNPNPVIPGTCTLSASASTITQGQSVTISWQTTNAVEFHINPNIGGPLALPNGSVTETPTQSITYTGKVWGQGVNGGDFNTCPITITVTPPKPPISCANVTSFTASPSTLPPGGGDTTLTWRTSNIASARLLGGGVPAANVPVNHSAVRNVTSNTTFTLQVTGNGNTAGNTVNCTVPVNVQPKQPISCANVSFGANPTSLPPGGGNTTLTWSTNKIASVKLDGAPVGLSDSVVRNVTANKTFTLQVTGNNTTTGNTVNCQVPVTVSPKQPISCPANVAFTANPTNLGVGGGDVTLTWNTNKISSVKLDGTAVGLSDSTVVNVTDDRTFNLEVVGDSTTAGNTETCPLPVTVDDPLPDPISCAGNVTFTANPGNVPFGGGDVKLEWDTNKIASVKLDGVTQDLSGSTTVNVTADQTFNLEVVGDGSTRGNTEICPVSVTVGNPDPISCAAHVNFSANPTNLGRGGGDVTLTWDTTKIASVKLDGADVALSDSTVVNVTSDRTFNLEVTGDNSTAGNTESCPVFVDVDTGGGGGGGGSSSPRCEFFISDDEIEVGEEVTLRWETRRGREVTIYEGDSDDGDVIFETDDDDEVDEGEIEVTPDGDTRYTLVVTRGSRDRECTVRVRAEEEDDEVVLTSSRVAGISLTQVPYTGFEAGPALAFFFYTLLAIWGVIVAYIFVMQDSRFFGVALAGVFKRDRIITDDVSTEATPTTGEPQAATYVASVTAPTQQVGQATFPSNLPTGNFDGVAETAGYAAVLAQNVMNTDEASEEMKELEDRAHASKTLLSSDAMRHLISTCPREISRLAFLDQIIVEARVSYPSEDGWVVLNLDRMVAICKKRVGALTQTTATAKVEVPVEKQINKVPRGSGSLAEAIVSGNITAAYQMIGHRPMISLADAAADLDGVYRARKGEGVHISELLKTTTANMPTEKIETAIAALTGALDGTYTDEEAAVKMAIMKATKALS